MGLPIEMIVRICLYIHDIFDFENFLFVFPEVQKIRCIERHRCNLHLDQNRTGNYIRATTNREPDFSTERDKSISIMYDRKVKELFNMRFNNFACIHLISVSKTRSRRRHVRKIWREICIDNWRYLMTQQDYYEFALYYRSIWYNYFK